MPRRPARRRPAAPAPVVPLAPVAFTDRETDARLVRPAAPGDLAYVCGVQKAHHAALGFIPRVALAQKIDLGRIRLALENGDPVGYLHHGSLAVPEVRVFQAAIQYDARRRHLGMALVDDLVARASAAGARAVSLRCLSELEANAFWEAAGFKLIDTEPGARGTLNVWGRVLDQPGAEPLTHAGVSRFPVSPNFVTPGAAAAGFPFHSRMHPCPRCGRWTNSSWARGARRFSLCAGCLRAPR